MRLGRVLCGLAVLTLAQSGYSQAPPDNATSAQGAASLGEEQQRQMAEYLKQRLPPPKEPSLPAPPPDPRNLEGTWIADQLTQLRLERDMYDQPLPLKPDARRVLDRRLKANYVDHRPYANAAASCRPAGQTWQLGLIFPFQIFQTKDAIAFVFSEMHTIWSLRLNQPHCDARQYMGDSVGHWDGNTLVIDTTNYKQPLWIDADGTPASMHLHATFRIRRIDYGQPKLEIVTTVDDPQMFSAPWSIVRTYVWRPDFAQFEQYDCEGQVSAPDALNQYSYQPEPSEAP